MASARKVELDCGGSFAQAAARAVAVRSEEVFAHAEGVLEIDEVERVHDMRVATRRLRAALEIFAPAFPPKRHRKALKRVKALADALGERRDADVEIALLQGLADPGSNLSSPENQVQALRPEERDALAHLAEDVRRRQLQANHELEPYVEPKRLRKLRRGLKKLVKAVDL